MLKGFWKLGIPLLAAIASLGLVGCAGSMMRIASDGKLPNEVPKDYHDKFEVKEAAVAPAPVPSPVAAITPAVATKPVKVQKSKKRKAVANPNDPAAVAQALALAGAEIKTAGKDFPNSALSGTIPNRRPKVDPFWVGEKLVYDVTWFGVSAGEFVLEVLPHKVINGRKVYHIKGTATSSKLFSMFYRLNDTVETFIDYEGLFPHRFHIVLDESKQTRDSLELYDNEKGQTFYWNRWNRSDRGYTEVKDFAPMPQFSEDTFSSLYYLRTLPMPVGGTVTIPMVSEAHTFDGIANVLRREKISSPMGKVECVVLKPFTRHQGVLKNNGENYMWMTDDDRKILVRLEAKVKVGTIVAALKKVEYGISPEKERANEAGQPAAQ